MTRDQFISKWKKVIAGGFVFGYADQKRLSTIDLAEKFLNVGPEVERLVGQMFDDLAAIKPPVPNPAIKK